MRFYLLDKVTAMQAGKEAHGVKCITLTDEVLHDHFPGYPIMPGTLITEGLAQLSGFLLETTVNDSDNKPCLRAILMQIDKMKLYHLSQPGECLHYTASITSLHEDAAQVAVEASVGGERRSSGKLTFALRPTDIEAIHRNRLELYRLWTRDLEACPTLR